MTLQQLDFAINDLIQKFEDDETTMRETEFLINITNDLIEMFHAKGIKLGIDKQEKYVLFEDTIENGWIYG